MATRKIVKPSAGFVRITIPGEVLAEHKPVKAAVLRLMKAIGDAPSVKPKKERAAGGKQ